MSTYAKLEFATAILGAILLLVGISISSTLVVSISLISIAFVIASAFLRSIQ